jgi:integrase
VDTGTGQAIPGYAAYGDFNYRSIGLIVHMAYEWAQRIGDMRNLQWSSLDLDAQRLDLEQSKRGVSVHIPISDTLDCYAATTTQRLWSPTLCSTTC